MKNKIYRVTLERHEPFKQFHKYVVAQNIDEAWDKGRSRGAEFNAKVRKNPCVVYGVKFTGEYQS